MEGLGEIKKDKCGLPYISNYKEDRKFLFITNLYYNMNK